MAMSLVRTSLCKPSLPGSLLNKEGCRGGSPRAWLVSPSWLAAKMDSSSSLCLTLASPSHLCSTSASPWTLFSAGVSSWSLYSMVASLWALCSRFLHWRCARHWPSWLAADLASSLSLCSTLASSLALRSTMALRGLVSQQRRLHGLCTQWWLLCGLCVRGSQQQGAFQLIHIMSLCLFRFLLNL